MNLPTTSPPSSNPAIPTTLGSMWQQYQHTAPAGDAVRFAAGGIRPAWTQFFETVANFDQHRLQFLEGTAARFFREHGATFHMHAGQDDAARPWELDPIPYIIEPAEWAQIEAGLLQRVTLLNLILGDIYGPRRLLSSGLLPQDVILRHPAFLRPCANIPLPSATQLFSYAADLARGPGGNMWLINDRTGSPPGMGYALENRTIMAQLFPNEFRSLGVQRLSHSFRAMRSGLAALGGSPAPRVVLHTPGPYSPSYFEHAYLAAYLGYTLVQGEDLLVRDGQVWLKALEGLQPVQVLIRRVTDAFCDPLELREDSMLGVAGLLEATRRGTVAVANPIGSQILENPGLFPFLQKISRDWLGQDLILPHAATWWCGHATERQHVLTHLDSLVVKTIDRSPIQVGKNWYYAPFQPGPELTAAIEREPWRFVGQERIHFSTAPVLVDGKKLEARVTTLRSFVTHNGSGYQALPGGLVRCGSLEQTYLPTKLFGGICKDAWVLSNQADAFVSMWSERHEEDQQTPFHGLFTSSAAENLFWTGRNAERARSLIHTLRVVLDQREPDTGAAAVTSLLACNENLWGGLLHQIGKLKPVPPSLLFAVKLVDDPEQAGGVPVALNNFCRAAYAVRENWSKDTWRIITRIQERLPTGKPRNRAERTQAAQTRLDDWLLLLQAFAGQSIETMTRTPGWQFLDLGRHLERALMMTDFLCGALEHPLTTGRDYDPLETLLQVHENLITYRRAYRTTPEFPTVMHLLLAEPTNPRSVFVLLHHIASGLLTLLETTRHAPTRDLAERLESEADALAALPARSWRISEIALIRARITTINAVLQETGEKLSHAYFKHAQLHQQPLFTSQRNPAGGGGT